MPQQVTISSTADGAIIIRGVGGTALEIVDESTPPPPPPPPPDPDPEPVPSDGIWISQSEIAELPMSGAGWSEVQAAAGKAGKTNLANQDSLDSTYVVAAAYVYARTGDVAARDRVLKAARDLVNASLENGSRALALGRELLGYIVAFDTANLKALDPDLEAKWRAKLTSLLTYKTSQAGSLIDCSLDRPNNWGGHSRATWLAGALYLGDKDGADRAVATLKGWMGDREVYAGFKYGDLDWQIDKDKPVGILPAAAQINGYNVDGGQPEELRRVSFKIPPSYVVYTWEGLQGPIAAAEMAYRAGYTDIWEYCDRALLRAVQFNYRQGWPAEGDDRWLIPIINRAYGTDFEVTGGGGGKNMAWTLWTHAN